ncbi:hypothetical protein [Photobacterium ganghwense]|uniref:hypothetical protein n=1 Tax=Photobacterium ganghwense TaxID=320778 RepID=UPI001C2DBCB2|nr:hypothetical protein [Photobacterium ganghwense]MBV1841410.1 hypothetical protein [Photobacterium ganghwense]
MRNTKIMLLAAIIASPLALADGGYGGYGGYDNGYDDYDNVTIDGSYNKTTNVDVDLSYDKTVNYSKYSSSDDDYLKMKNVGNTHEFDYEDNSYKDASKDVDIDVEVNKYLAESTLYGSVMDTSVTYGGACCKGSSTDVMVDHANNMHMSYGSASGINIAGQNVGNNSLVQQTSSTNAAVVGSGSGGSY